MDRSAAWRGWVGASLVTFAISERMFWAFFRHGDTAGDLALTFLAYSVVVALALAVWRRCGVATFSGVMLVGALVGWLSEGVIVATALGSGENPFPLSISWTGLGWHALATVGLGLFLLPRALAGPRRHRTMAGCGLAWGLWAGWYPGEPNGLTPTFQNFATHTVFTAAMLGLGWALMRGVALSPTTTDRRTILWLGGGALAAFVAFRVIFAPVQALGLLACVGATGVALLRAGEPGGFVWPEFPARNLDAVVTLGASAVGTFGALRLLDFAPPTHIITYVIATPLGFWFWGRAVWRGLRRA